MSSSSDSHGSYDENFPPAKKPAALKPSGDHIADTGKMVSGDAGKVVERLSEIEQGATGATWIQDAARDAITTLERQLATAREALEEISQHPIHTPVGGRPSLGVRSWPSCQDIAIRALTPGVPDAE